jgi:hypothetical protein
MQPTWVRADEWDPAPWHRWIRYTIGPRNVRLKIAGGEHFVVIDAADMRDFAATMASRDRHGMLIAAEWYFSNRKAERKAA